MPLPRSIYSLSLACVVTFSLTLLTSCGESKPLRVYIAKPPGPFTVPAPEWALKGTEQDGLQHALHGLEVITDLAFDTFENPNAELKQGLLELDHSQYTARHADLLAKLDEARQIANDIFKLRVTLHVEKSIRNSDLAESAAGALSGQQERVEALQEGLPDKMDPLVSQLLKIREELAAYRH